MSSASQTRFHLAQAATMVHKAKKKDRGWCYAPVPVLSSLTALGVN